MIPHGVERQHPRCADLLQCTDVCAVIDLVRLQRMPFAMACQEGDAVAEQHADADRPGRRAVGRLYVVRLHIVQLRELVDTRAADDGQCDGICGHNRPLQRKT